MSVQVETAASQPIARQDRPGKQRGGKWWLYVLLGMGLIGMIGPFLWMALGAFKTQRELLQVPPSWLPENPTLENFRELFGRLDFALYFGNSVFVSVVVVGSNVLLSAMLGYALAKLKFAGRRALFGIIVATILIPVSVRIVPMFVLMSKLQLVNTLIAVVLGWAVWPLGVFLMRQFMMQIPDELIDAARIDGAGEFRIFFRIALPLVLPGIAVLSILAFLFSWNDLLWPLIVLTDDQKYTLPVALATFATGQNQTDYGLLMAGSLMVVLPVIFVYLLLQRHFTQTMATTGVK